METMETKSETKRYAYRTREVAELLGVSTSTVNRLVQSGELVARRVYAGGPRRFFDADIQEYVARLRAKENPLNKASEGQLSGHAR